MLSKEHLEYIEREARLLLEKLIEDARVSVEQEEGSGAEPVVRLSLQAPEPKMLIGERGQTLFELERVLRLVLRRKIAEPFSLRVDVNEYRKNKEEYLRDLAQNAADEVVLLKKEKELPAMPASDRRVVHEYLGKRGDVVSESAGEGASRRVVVKPSTAGVKPEQR